MEALCRCECRPPRHAFSRYASPVGPVLWCPEQDGTPEERRRRDADALALKRAKKAKMKADKAGGDDKKNNAYAAYAAKNKGGGASGKGKKGKK